MLVDDPLSVSYRSLSGNRFVDLTCLRSFIRFFYLQTFGDIVCDDVSDRYINRLIGREKERDRDIS